MENEVSSSVVSLAMDKRTIPIPSKHVLLIQLATVEDMVTTFEQHWVYVKLCCVSGCDMHYYIHHDCAQPHCVFKTPKIAIMCDHKVKSIDNVNDVHYSAHL